MSHPLDTVLMAATAGDDMLTSAPDADIQRGRKRLRLRDEFDSRGTNNLTRRKKTPSGESATLRGRCRHRSTSVTGRSSRSRSFARDRVGGAGGEDGKHHHHHIFRVVQLNGGGGSGRGRRRSQSPSRSYSHSHMRDGPRRRRQRTRSRSRDHFFGEHHHHHHQHHHHHPSNLVNSVVELKSPLCLEMMVDDGGGGCCSSQADGLED